jgi:hypothetical protein
LALAVKANLSVMRSLENEITILERVVKDGIKVKPAYRYLLTVSGIGQILALTIMLETTHRVVAIKAVAHKLARACFYVMRDEVPFDVDRAFA